MSTALTLRLSSFRCARCGIPIGRYERVCLICRTKPETRGRKADNREEE